MRKTWQERVDAVRGLPVPAHLDHGRNTWARKGYGCSCPVCLPSGRGFTKGSGTTQAVRSQRLRESKAGQPVPAGTKHGVYTYKTYRCRCDVCVTAAATQRRRRDAAFKPGARGVWTITPRTTTVHWKPRTAGPDWACPVCKEAA